MNDALVVFSGDMEYIRFVDKNTGKTIDPRMVLQQLLLGLSRLQYSNEIETVGGIPTSHVRSETWKVCEASST